MTPFIIVAAVMTAIAAAAVALPLLKDRRNRGIAALSVVLVAVAAGALYEWWSTWDWSAPANPDAVAVSPQVAAMIAKLETHMREHPDDLSGWLMLGRSYVATGRLDEAIVAYDRALSLSGGKSLEATIGYGEALAVQAGGKITPRAAKLFEQAVALAPDNPKALLYGGFAAAMRGDDDLARKRWEALIAMHPPDPVVKLLNARIAQLGPETAAAGATGGAASAGPAGASAGPADTAPPGSTADSGVGARAGARGAAASVRIRLTIAPQLRGRLRGDAPLFVFAKQPGAGGPPLAVKRLTTAAIGSAIELSSADSMIPGRALRDGEHVQLTARVSFGGQPLPAAGDLYGEVQYDVGTGGTVNLVINRVQP